MPKIKEPRNLPLKTKDGRSETPAQRIGIADRKYEIEDIIYFK